MSKLGKIIIALVVATVIVAALVALFAKNGAGSEQPDTSTTPDSSAQTPTDQNQEPTKQDDSESEIALTVTYTNNGFVQDALSMSAGGTVQVTNDSDSDLEFVSDPHPVHTDNDEFNVGLIAPGETKTFVATQTGTWGFHNHLQTSHQGSVVVEQ